MFTLSLTFFVASGGTKRKLCTAIALVGDTPVLMLDEPTAGVDPAARQFLWTTIVKLIQEGRSIVITSHRCEEKDSIYWIIIMWIVLFLVWRNVKHFVHM